MLSPAGNNPTLRRTIPIDDLQTMALKKLLVRLNLTYIGLFYDSSAYGVGLKEMLENEPEGALPVSLKSECLFLSNCSKTGLLK